MRKTAIAFLLSALVSVPLLAGDLQVMAPEGFSVYIDDRYAGVTNREMSGLVSTDLPDGDHLIRVNRDGYVPVESRVTIVARRTFVLEITPVKANLKVEERATTQIVVGNAVGVLDLRSLPVKATVAIDGTELGETDLRIADFPVGQYTVSFSRAGKTIAVPVLLTEADTLDVKANFINNTYAIQSLIDSCKDTYQVELDLELDWTTCREGSRYDSKGRLEDDAELRLGKIRLMGDFSSLEGKDGRHFGDYFAQNWLDGAQVHRSEGATYRRSLSLDFGKAGVRDGIFHAYAEAVADGKWERSGLSVKMNSVWFSTASSDIQLRTDRRTIVRLQLRNERLILDSAYVPLQVE